MGFSETFGVEKGSGTRVVEWLNSEALAKKYKTAQNKTVTVSSISDEQMKSTETFEVHGSGSFLMYSLWIRYKI